MRRAIGLGALGLCAASAVIVAGPARADDGNWSGGWQQSSYTFTDAASHNIAGALTHGSQTSPDRREITIHVDVAGDAPSSCAKPSGFTDDVNDSGTVYSVTNYFSTDVQPECNGTYNFVAWGSVPDAQPFAGPDSSGPVETTVVIKRPAPVVTGVEAAKSTTSRAVIVSWDALGASKDLTGIVITRTDAGGTTVDVGHLGPSTTAFSDSTIPTDGGSFTYAVSSTRYGVSPSAATQAAVIKIDKVPDATATTSTTSTTPSATVPGGDGGTGTGTGTGAGGAGPPATSSRRADPGRPVQAVDPDEGYETALPYEAEPGAVAAELPSGDEHNPAGAGVLVPFAVSLVLGVWAVLILYVTKSAREADEALTLLHLELE